MSDSSSNRGGVTLLGLVFIVFLTLKLTDKIEWSWWWVTAPLWGPLGLFLVAAGLVAAAAVLFTGVARLFGRKPKTPQQKTAEALTALAKRLQSKRSHWMD